MLIDLDQGDGDSDESELITDPVIKRYATKLHQLTWELIQETEHYELNREQINQLIDALTTFRNLLVVAEDLSTLDAMLRMTFPNDYLVATADALPILTNFPLSGNN